MKKFVSMLAITLGLMSAFTVNAQMSSYSRCYAYTACRNGGAVSCQVYGSARVYGPGNMSNACSWYVQPYVGVQCSGYVAVNGYWMWQNYTYYCP